LETIISAINFPVDKDVLVGFGHNDDAGIYKLNDDLAIVQTLDFITPVVDDPYIFGQIAAANSLSDVFAMGGRVITALNIVAYDSCNVTKAMLSEILQGGADKVREAGGSIIGGHSVEDLEMKFGLSVTGIVHPQHYTANNRLESGDILILTKPLGMGVITTSIKAEMAPDSAIEKAVFHMSYLNKTASELALQFNVKAMTDVTGFGLLGHLLEMIDYQHTVELYGFEVPIIFEAFDLAETGLFPGGSFRNERFCRDLVKVKNKELSKTHLMLMYDAQTSGGLVIAVKPDQVHKLLSNLHDAGLEWCKIIGTVKPKEDYLIEII
jgi:selenide,water dikinase